MIYRQAAQLLVHYHQGQALTLNDCSQLMTDSCSKLEKIAQALAVARVHRSRTCKVMSGLFLGCCKAFRQMDSGHDATLSMDLYDQKCYGIV